MVPYLREVMAFDDGHYHVSFDTEAAVFDVAVIASKGERKAINAVVLKLAHLGPNLAPPHIKRLAGHPGLAELRPRRGDAPSRPVVARVRDRYVVLAVARNHADLPAAIERAVFRLPRHHVAPSR